MKRPAVAGNQTQDTWLSYDNRTTTSPHNPLYMYCTGGTEMPQLHTWQPLSMCRQNSIRVRPKNSLHQERTHTEWFSQSKCVQLRHFSPTCAVHIEDCGGGGGGGCPVVIAQCQSIIYGHLWSLFLGEVIG